MAEAEAQVALLEDARQRCKENDQCSMWNWSNFDLNDMVHMDKQVARQRARQDRTIIIECWMFEKSSAVSEAFDQQVRYIEEDDLITWLEKPHPTQNGQLPCAGLKLIHKYTDGDIEMPWSPETVAAIHKSFSIPAFELHQASRFSGAFGRFMSQDSSPVLICKKWYGWNGITTALRHDFTADLTVGYIMSGLHSDIHGALLAIPAQFQLCSHPLLVPLLMSEKILETYAWRRYAIDRGLATIEYATGYHNWGEEEEASNADFQALARELGASAHDMASDRSGLLQLKSTHSFLLRELVSAKLWMPANKWPKYTPMTAMLQQRGEYTASNIDNLLECHGLEGRMQAQQNVLFNLINQADTKITISLSDEMRRIAVKAKHDSSIMKVIAFLGTVFLPATFISTFFAMPLFHWDAPTTSEIASNHFWIYWAVTAPLTLVTMAIVGYFIMTRSRITIPKKKLEDKVV